MTATGAKRLGGGEGGMSMVRKDLGRIPQFHTKSKNLKIKIILTFSYLHLKSDRPSSKLKKATPRMIGTRPLANASRKKNGRVRLATNSPSLASAYFPVI